jgi:UDP-glucose 4-epimerase/UDP-glucuronate decarboxylase
MPEGRRILITGGAGFIGWHLANDLASEPETEIVLADDFSRGRKDADLAATLAKSNVALISADLADPNELGKLGRGFDEVYHLAGKLGVANTLAEPYAVLRGNALATLNVLDWFLAGGGARFLYASTSEVYAWTQAFHPLPIPTPEGVPLALTDLHHPRASYAGAKIFGELAAIQACSKVKKPCAVVRYHNVYGPRMGYAHVIPELYRRARDGENPLLVRSAAHVRAFCYVSDAVCGTIAALRQCAAAEIFNIGNDAEPVTIAELARRLLAAARIDAKIVALPAHPSDPIAERCPDIAKARARLGFSPAVDLDQGLRLSLDWYAAQVPEPQHQGRHVG